MDTWPIDLLHFPFCSVSLQSQVCVISTQGEKTDHSHQSCQHHDGTASKHVSGAPTTLPSTCSWYLPVEGQQP